VRAPGVTATSSSTIADENDDAIPRGRRNNRVALSDPEKNIQSTELCFGGGCGLEASLARARRQAVKTKDVAVDLEPEWITKQLKATRTAGAVVCISGDAIQEHTTARGGGESQKASRGLIFMRRTTIRQLEGGKKALQERARGREEEKIISGRVRSGKVR
jgi:hypothetical protein